MIKITVTYDLEDMGDAGVKQDIHLHHDVSPDATVDEKLLASVIHSGVVDKFRWLSSAEADLLMNGMQALEAVSGGGMTADYDAMLLTQDEKLDSNTITTPEREKFG